MKIYNPFSNEHPLIHMVNLKRIDFPLELLNQEDWYIYVEPSSKLINKRAPQEVLELFQILDSLGNKGNTVKLDGWTWERSKSNDRNTYIRAEYIPSDPILACLEPYLSKLEELVGKTVPSIELIPPFSFDNLYRFYDLPGVEQKLNFLKSKKTEEGDNTVTLGILTIIGNASGVDFITSIPTPIAQIKYEVGIKK